MDGRLILNYSLGYSDYVGNESFLDYEINKAVDARATLYQSFKRLDDLNLLHYYCPPYYHSILPDYKFYDFVPLEKHDLWG